MEYIARSEEGYSKFRCEKYSFIIRDKFSYNHTIDIKIKHLPK